MKIKRFISLLLILVQLAAAPTTFAASVSPSAAQLSIKSTWKWMRKDPPADVSGHWAERVIQWGLRNRIVEGYPDGTLQPDRTIVEAEFLLMLYRSYEVRPTAVSNEAWSDSPYGFAQMWHHPTLGLQNAAVRTVPITRGTAAEILCAVLGFNYSGTEAIRYVLGIGLAEGKIGISVEGFAAQDTVTRAEALQWFRNLKLLGSFKIVERPSEASDPNRIPPLPVEPADEITDFLVQHITLEDFQLQALGGEKSFPLGTLREAIEEQWGPSEGQNMFQADTYGQLSVHYNSEGHMDSWMVSDFGRSEIPPVQTAKGLVMNQSELSDVLRLYGSAGFYLLSPTVEYLYEEVNGQLILRQSKLDIIDQSKAYYVGINIRKETGEVSSIWFAAYSYAFRDDSKK